MNIIILRGNSGSGKSTIAEEIRRCLDQKVVMISQDNIRLNILGYVDWGNTSLQVIPIMEQIIKSAHELDCKYVVIEGIFNRDKYKSFFEKLVESNDLNIFAYYFDLNWEETLRRHQTRNKKNDFGVKEMKKWFREKDYLQNIDEFMISADMSQDEIVAKILGDVKNGNCENE